MSETKRDLAARSLATILHNSEFIDWGGCHESAKDIVRLIIDAAKEEIRAELEHGPTSLRPELRAIADASWARNEAAYRYLARDGKDAAPLVPCYQCATMCPCPGSWFSCSRCGLHQRKPADRAAEPRDEDPGRCERCGEPFELVRPGKSQPTCACWGKDV